MMTPQARPSAKIMGFDTHMILEAVPARHSEHQNGHQPINQDITPLCRGPGELTQVKAKPGEYIEESYERWRLHGLPIWAALAAGMKPTPGSRKLIGRRPNLP